MQTRCKCLQIWKMLTTPIAVVLASAPLTVLSKVVFMFHTWITAQLENRADLFIMGCWCIVVTVVMWKAKHTAVTHRRNTDA